MFSEAWRLAAPLPLRARMARTLARRRHPKTRPSVQDVKDRRFPHVRSLPVFTTPDTGRRRVTVVTDSLSPGSLFGGVGTSMIVGALLAQRLDASLRVVTRYDPPDPTAFATVLRAHGVVWEENVDFVFSSRTHDGAPVGMHDGDLFFTTSWWSTWAALQSVDPASIVYLLQEDERLFYPSGDEQLLCGETLSDDRIRFLVNTEMLYAYLVEEGFRSIETRGVAFEPAFPSGIYYRHRQNRAARRRFFFYARPNHYRNLFVRGLEAIDTALLRGTLRPNEWDFYFVGQSIPKLTLSHAVEPRRAEDLAWPDYAALIRSMDIGVSLMNSPHPSYPPLDLAACGAVAVTNRYGPKRSLERYSSNIICADPSKEALVEAISEAVRLVDDEERRQQNYESSPIRRDWSSSLAPVLDALARKL